MVKVQITLFKKVEILQANEIDQCPHLSIIQIKAH